MGGRVVLARSRLGSANQYFRLQQIVGFAAKTGLVPGDPDNYWHTGTPERGHSSDPPQSGISHSLRCSCVSLGAERRGPSIRFPAFGGSRRYLPTYIIPHPDPIIFAPFPPLLLEKPRERLYRDLSIPHSIAEVSQNRRDTCKSASFGDKLNRINTDSIADPGHF
jgi:hypothetical protein